MIKNKRIGIWGFGIVGKAAARYFHTLGSEVEVFDARPLNTQEQEFITNNSLIYNPHQRLEQFLEQNPYIVPSPGIDLRPYDQYKTKWIAELDLFRHQFQKPIIAITGSVGKTSVTHILSHILHKKNKNIITGGNIGVGMLDLAQHDADFAVLEVSSFQLELCQTFAPDLAICTNIYPNHLDRHGSFAAYVDAKYKIIENQTAHQHALLPFSCMDEFLSRKKTQSNISYFMAEAPTPEQLRKVDAATALFYCDGTAIIKQQGEHKTQLIALSEIPSISFIENWLIVYSALNLLGLSLHDIDKNFELDLPDHRLEKVAAINGIDFYNDSKSTTPASTLAALKKITGKPTHLFIGGISKGIDRSPFIRQLKDKVSFVYCFGKEAEQLHALCIEADIPSSSSVNLETAFEICTKNIRSSDIVLFSPAGASFDLFEDYKKRGECFKQLVAQISTKK